MDFSGSEICWPKKYEIWSEMGPYGSVGTHIKTGRSPMAQDHFKTTPDPKKGHGMTKNPQNSKKYSRVGQELVHDQDILLVKNMKFDLKCVHMADEAIWRRSSGSFLKAP